MEKMIGEQWQEEEIRSLGGGGVELHVLSHASASSSAIISPRGQTHSGRKMCAGAGSV